MTQDEDFQTLVDLNEALLDAEAKLATAVKALENITDWLKINKRSVLYGMSRQEIDGLMSVLHEANVALAAQGNEP